MSLLPENRVSDPYTELEPFRRVSAAFKVPCGATLYNEGDAAENVYLIETGLVVLSMVDENGQQFYLAQRSSGWIGGTVEVLLNRPYLATATTKKPSKMRIVSASRFLHELQNNGAFSQYIHRMQASAVHEYSEKAAGLALCSVRQRLEEFLWNQYGYAADGKGRFELPFLASEVAQFVGSSPQHLSAVFGELEREGVLKRSKGWLIVEDQSRLWRRRR
jgi:CRP/FNR family transcriptional regulator